MPLESQSKLAVEPGLTPWLLTLSRALSTVILPVLGQKVSESGCDMCPHWGQAISENQ